MLRRIVSYVTTPLYRFIVRHVPQSDPWERLTARTRLAVFGPGLRHDFSHFLEGESTVNVSSIDDIEDWLLGCKYESDRALFNESDFWQHPITFEHLRAGDCEDFALWAWRKLLGLGIDADLVVGYCVGDGKLGAGAHAWVVVRKDNEEFLFEPGARARDRMIKPISEVRKDYIPRFGVDRNAHRFAFAGYFVSEKMRLDGEIKPTTHSTAV
jgi:predicted transglutaminase-like cysteine proteinase